MAQHWPNIGPIMLIVDGQPMQFLQGQSQYKPLSQYNIFFFLFCLSVVHGFSLMWAIMSMSSIHNLESDQLIPLWWAKFELEGQLIISIYFNSKFKVTCNNKDVKCWCIELISKKNRLKICTISVASFFGFFSHQHIKTNLPSGELCCLLFSEKHISKW